MFFFWSISFTLMAAYSFLNEKISPAEEMYDQQPILQKTCLVTLWLISVLVIHLKVNMHLNIYKITENKA